MGLSEEAGSTPVRRVIIVCPAAGIAAADKIVVLMISTIRAVALLIGTGGVSLIHIRMIIKPWQDGVGL